MKRIILTPYTNHSASVINLQRWMRENGFPKIKRTTAPSDNRFIINWGNSSCHSNNSDYLNHPTAVGIASNKVKTFVELAHMEVATPDWTQSKEEAQQWVTDGSMVFARTTVTGHSGNGIIICEAGSTITVDAPLYVKYKKKRAEYRVHVFDGRVIDVQQKKKRSGQDSPINTLIRNHANGWVFCRENVQPNEDVLNEAINAIHATFLNFGAVDVIWNEHDQKAYVLEINTAPGLEGTSVEIYGNAIKEYVNVHNQ